MALARSSRPHASLPCPRSARITFIGKLSGCSNIQMIRLYINRRPA